MPANNTTRFSNRVEDYVKYRPGYPPALIAYLQQQYSLTTDRRLADIGAGTGISAKLFLEAGYRVVAVEPNAGMREKSVELLGDQPGFSAVNGTAEDTTLPTGSIDAIISAQAFHWFDAGKCRAEFQRVLKPNGLIVLIWNERRTGSAFEKEYDEFIGKHAIDYAQVDHRNISDDRIAAFFDPKPFQLQVFYNEQVFDFNSLAGRLSSSSYMPAKNAVAYPAMIRDLKILFDQHQQNGSIVIQYDTKVYAGTV